MRLDFTSAVTLALERARHLARQQGLARIEPVHLLHGLLHDDEGQPAVLLTKAGLDLPAFLASLQTESAAGPVSPAEDISFSEATWTLLRQAAELNSTLSGESAVASDQVLLALLQYQPLLRARLENLGCHCARLEKDMLASQLSPLPLEEPLLLADSPGHLASARIVDACTNRAREALRVLEDYCRFALDDAFLSSELKRLRHDLATLTGSFPWQQLLAARDTPGDVGTTFSTPQEQDRSSLQAVVQANSKRLQEALRSLEEFGKLGQACLGQALEQLRYRAYTLERALVLGGMARHRLSEARLYVLATEASCKFSLAGTIAEAAAGGAQILQLREKNLDDRTLLQRAREVRFLTRKHGLLFIMNDRPDLAVLAQADGVHLGQDDLPLPAARRIVGPDALIGVSTHNIEQVRQAVLEGASYIGIGPTFASNTKNFADYPGLAFVRQALAETSLPAFVLGGVNLENLGQVVAAGGKRVAVSQAICQAAEPRKVAAAMRQLLEG